MSIGDVNSNKRGTGARFNSGKPDYSLIFLENMLIGDEPIQNPNDELRLSIICLSGFQEHGDVSALKAAYRHFCRYAQHTSLFENEGYYMDSVVRVWEYGKEKYAAWNWAKGMNWSVPVACFARHYISFNHLAEYEDPESGQPHWAHCICNLQMLLRYVEHFPEGNDLPHNVLDMEKED